MVLLDSWKHDTPKYAMCGVLPADLHHRITRARGGKILDNAGETYHLMRLCRKHHKVAHDEPAMDSGLLLPGSVTTCPTCKRPKYIGSDPYLTEKYGDVAHDLDHKVIS